MRPDIAGAPGVEVILAWMLGVRSRLADFLIGEPWRVAAVTFIAIEAARAAGWDKQAMLNMVDEVFNDEPEPES